MTYIIVVIFLAGPLKGTEVTQSYQSLQECERWRPKVLTMHRNATNTVYVSQCVKHVNGYDHLEAK